MVSGHEVSIVCMVFIEYKDKDVYDKIESYRNDSRLSYYLTRKY